MRDSRFIEPHIPSVDINCALIAASKIDGSVFVEKSIDGDWLLCKEGKRNKENTERQNTMIPTEHSRPFLEMKVRFLAARGEILDSEVPRLRCPDRSGVN